MIFSKERLTLSIAILMFVIGVMPSWYIFNLGGHARIAKMDKDFNYRHFPIGMDKSILGPITCPSIMVAGDTVQVMAEVNIPEDLLSEYRIYMRGEDFSDTADESIVIEEVTDWRESNQTGDSKSQFLWLVTISQPGIYEYAVVARNKADDQDQNTYYPGGRWENSDFEECALPVISSIGFTGKQILTINKFWIAMFLIAGLGICVWWFFTYPSLRRILKERLLITIPAVCILYVIAAVIMPFEIFILLALVFPLLLVFLMIPQGQKGTEEGE
jgi:hypothetical protein